MTASAIIPKNPFIDQIVQAAHGLGLAGDWVFVRETNVGLGTYAKWQGDTVANAEAVGAGLALIVDANSFTFHKTGALAPLPIGLVTNPVAAVDGDTVWGSATVAGRLETAAPAVGGFQCQIGRFVSATKFYVSIDPQAVQVV
jgi:hypothetical protein